MEHDYEDDDEVYENDFYQTRHPITDISDIEWTEIRSIGRELMKAKMFEGDQFKISIEAFHRWCIASELNSSLDEEFKGQHNNIVH